MKIDHYPNPRTYPRHLRKPYNLASLEKTSKPAFGRGKYTPFGAFGTTFPPEGELVRWTKHCHVFLNLNSITRRGRCLMGQTSACKTIWLDEANTGGQSIVIKNVWSE